MSLPAKRGLLMGEVDHYLAWGGFPEVAIDGIDPRDYLSTLVDAILYKDIVVRHEIRSPRLLGQLFMYLLSNFAREYTFNSLKNGLGASSGTTVEAYVSYLEEAFLLFSLERFSHKIKETVRAPRKVYIVDNGLVSSRARLVSQDRGRLLENAVLLELLRKGRRINRDLFYYRTKGDLEVDFLVLDSACPAELIQVCYEMDCPATKRRELRALVQAATELRLTEATIVTWGEEERIEEANCWIRIIPFWRFATDG